MTRLFAILLLPALACAHAPADACGTECAAAKYCSERCPANERCLSRGTCDEPVEMSPVDDDAPSQNHSCGGDAGEVRFALNSNDLAPCAEVVRAMAATLRSSAYRDTRFRLVGFWGVGESEPLGRSRAAIVAQALLASGVSTAQLTSLETRSGPPSVRLELSVPE